ncbi:hypothetical protein ACQ4PT_060553 [Festuca glaucescens]
MATSASALILPRLPMSPPMPARASSTATMTRRRTRPLRAACAYALQEGQSRRSHRLPCGLDLEVIAQQPPTPTPGRSERPPLVFLHGSFHAAWCWAEHWLPFFSRAGFSCFALSLRAQGESSIPSEAVAGTLETHSGDIADFIRKEVPDPPILIGHSFGGLIVQQYISCLQVLMSNVCLNFLMELMSVSSFTLKSLRVTFSIINSEPLHPKLSGAVLVCSVPPSGNSGLVWRYLLTKPIAAVKVTLSLAAKVYANSLPLCKETFFSSEMDDELVLRYQGLMKDSSKLPLLDLRKLNASLPVPSAANGTLEVLVMGASNDFIVPISTPKIRVRLVRQETRAHRAARLVFHAHLCPPIHFPLHRNAAPPLPRPSTATLPRLHRRLPHSLLLLRRAASRHTRLLLPAAAAGSLPPRPPTRSSRTRPRASSRPPRPTSCASSSPPPPRASSSTRGADLLCVVRALLKKIRRRVLVGDRVLVGAVDWTDRRGMIEDVFEPRTEVADPPVANVDRIVLLFSLDQPQPEPATLTRFLVDAESAGIPFVLVFTRSSSSTNRYILGLDPEFGGHIQWSIQFYHNAIALKLRCHALS